MNLSKRNQLLSMAGLFLFAGCSTQNLVQENTATERRVLGVVNVEFVMSATDNVVMANAKFQPTPKLMSQAAPTLPLPDNAITLERIYGTRTDYFPTRQRFVASTLRVTNNTNTPFNNLTLYAINRTIGIGGTAFTNLLKEDSTPLVPPLDPDPVDTARKIKPNHGMRINATTLSLEVDPSKADFQAISSAEATTIESLPEMLGPTGLIATKSIQDVLEYGYVARNFALSGNRRTINASGGKGQVSLAFNLPLESDSFRSPGRLFWSFLVVDEPVTRVTRSIEEGSNVQNVADRAQDTGVAGAEVALMGRSLASIPITTLPATTAPNTVYTGASLKQIPFNQVRIATFPTYISDFGVIWVQASASPGGNGSPGLPFQTIQEGVNAAVTGDVIRVRSGTYPGAVNVDRGVQIYGPVSSTDGRDPSRCVTGSEPTCSSDAKITGQVVINTPASNPVTFAGFRFEDNGFVAAGGPTRVALEMPSLQGHIIENNVFYRNGSNPADAHPSGFANAAPSRAISSSPSAGGVVTIRQNRISGNPSTGMFRNKSWDRGIWNDGGLNTTVIRDNTIDSVRSALNLETPTASYLITGNIFTGNGTAISYGTFPTTNITLSGNEFNWSSGATILNMQNTNPNFVLTVNPSTNKFNGVFPSVMTRPQLFALEDGILHRLDKSCGGIVRVIPNNLYVTAGSFANFGCASTTSADIQRAIDAALVGTTINVNAGTYTNQLTITKDLSIVGEGATTIIKAPAVLSVDPLNSSLTSIVRLSNNATVTMNMLNVSGPGPTGCGSLTYGIFVVEGATLNMNTSSVTDVRDNPISGCQNGLAIRAGSPSLFQSGSLNITNSIFTGFQKGAIVVSGVGSNALINNNTITGTGPMGIAANGIQVSSGATATITGNTITNNQCNIAGPICGPTGAWSTGILVFGSLGVTITGNTISDNDSGMLVYGFGGFGVDGTISGNRMLNNLYANASIGSQGTITFSGNTLVGGLTGLDLYIDSSLTGNLNLNGTGNKISGATNGIFMTDDAPADAYQINLNLTLGNITGIMAGLNNTTTVPATVTNNWWGDATGPTNAGNPGGTGSVITGPANFSGFLAAAIP